MEKPYKQIDDVSGFDLNRIHDQDINEENYPPLPETPKHSAWHSIRNGATILFCIPLIALIMLLYVIMPEAWFLAVTRWINRVLDKLSDWCD